MGENILKERTIAQAHRHRYLCLNGSFPVSEGIHQELLQMEQLIYHWRMSSTKKSHVQTMSTHLVKTMFDGARKLTAFNIFPYLGVAPRLGNVWMVSKIGVKNENTDYPLLSLGKDQASAPPSVNTL